MPDCNYPHIMRDIIKEMVLFERDNVWSPWFKPRYFRRGRLVENLATRIAYGNPLPDDDPWWSEASGNPNDPDDYLPHEECRDSLGGVKQFLDEMGFVLARHQLSVRDEVLKVQGMIDWFGSFKDRPDQLYIIDIKRGAPPPDGTLKEAYRFQTAGYKLALATDRGYIAKRAGLHLYDDTYKFVPHDEHKHLIEWPKVVWSYYFRNRYTKE